MAIKGAFAAGFAQGFVNSFTKGIEERQKRAEELIEQNMDAAKRIAPAYMKANNEYNQIKEYQRAMKRDFNLTDDEFVALVDATDIHTLFKDVNETKMYRETNGLGTLDKSEILKLVNMPEGFKLPQNMTSDQALRQIMGLQTAALEKEADPKSEGARQRSWASAVKDLFMLDPKMSAEEQLKNMKYLGVSVSDLNSFMATGGTKQDLFADVSSASSYGLRQDDYKPEDVKTTRNEMARTLSIGVTKYDLTDNTQFLTYSADGKDKQAAELKKSILDTAFEMPVLERQIIMAARGNDAIAGRVGRFQILNDLASAVDNPEEIVSLKESIKSRFAIDVIKGAISENRDLTEKEIDAIIAGKFPEDKEEEKPTDDLEAATPSAVVVPDVVMEDPELLTAFNALTVEEQKGKAEEINSSSEDNKALVAKMIIGAGTTPEVAEDTVVDTAGEVAQQNIDTIEAFKEAASKVTYEEYKNMSKAERKEAGLPVRGIDSLASFGVMNPKMYFKGGGSQIDLGDIDENTTDRMVVATSALKLYREMEKDFPDMSVIQGEDGKTVIEDFLRMSNLPVNPLLIELVQRYAEDVSVNKG